MKPCAPRQRRPLALPIALGALRSLWMPRFREWPKEKGNGPSWGCAGAILSRLLCQGDVALENLISEAFLSAVTRLGY